MKKSLLFIGMISWASTGFTQTMPSAFDLSSGNYSFTTWDSLSSAGSYPPNMIFQISTNADPAELDEPTGDWLCLYNLTSRSRVNGLGVDGIAFLNTSNFQDTDIRCGGDPGDIGGYMAGTVVGINASNRQNIGVSFKATLITQGDGLPAPRVYNLQLQYKAGNGNWTNVNAGTFSSNGLTSGDDQNFTNLTLPAECNNQSQLYIRWKYFMLSENDGGTRPRIGLDEININSDVFTNIEPSKNLIEQSILGQNENSIFISQASTIQIFDLVGRLVTTQNNTTKIDITNLGEGNYLLRTKEGMIYRFTK
jgi:hypothetical protein